MSSLRIGQGEDIHVLVPNRPLILAGVHVPYELGLLGHSDADVVYHAIADSILGALALGDIGVHFPTNDPQYDNIDSARLVEIVVRMMKERGYRVNNIDVSIACEKPHLNPHREAMRKNIASLLRVSATEVGLQLMTNEGMDAVGEGKAIRATAIVLLTKGEIQ